MTIIRITVFHFFIVVGSLTSLAAKDRPNVIIVLADDLSASFLPSYGGESVETPVLDRLAAEGMRYEYCFSPALCMPSRTELLTGKYSHRNFLGRGNLAKGERNIASVLKRAGYATCQVEKWHLNINDGAMPLEVGFDEYYHVKLANNYYDPVIDANGEEQRVEGGYGPKVCQEYAFDFIDRHREQPFFLYYAMHLPHAPYHVPPSSELGEKSSKLEQYSAMVEHQDLMMGELVAYLESLGLREKTLVIFLGDNGTPKDITYQSGGKTLTGGKASPLDSGMHVPMIVSWPGTALSGVVTNALIDFADFLPTIMDLAGVEIRDGMKLDGRSFYGQLLGQSDAPQRDFAFKFGCQNGGKGAGPANGYWARTQRWKLYGKGEFYDMQNDPLEEQPLETASLEGEAQTAYQQLVQVLKESGAEEATREYRRSQQKK